LRTPVSRPHPSLLFLPGLRSLPFWTSNDGNRIAYNDPTVTKVVEYFQQPTIINTIRQEYLDVASQLDSDYLEDNGHPSQLHEGKWDWHSYMNKGSIQGHFCQHFPKTTQILQQGLRQQEQQDSKDDLDLYPQLLFEGTPFGFCFFSTLHKKSKISSHTAPMNLRLRLHIPLIVPTTETTTTSPSGDNDRPVCGIRVGPFVRGWTEGKVLVLDDSYDHEVWNDTDENRVILLVDIWHPDIPPVEKKAIVDLFQKAKQDGLWKK
jgi:aspartate beta-hydroxylase